MRVTKKQLRALMPKVGEIVRVKNWQLGELRRRVVEVDLKHCAIIADDGKVYMLSSELDSKGHFFF